MDTVAVEIIGLGSPHLERVKGLHRSQSGQLGMFPNGAFEEHAWLKRILVAVDGTSTCVGYALYRVAKGRAMIVHLCVDEKEQHKGIGKALVRRLCEITKEQTLSGVGLWCRRDYEATKIWPRYGFVPVAERAGKSLDGSELTFWWFDHKQPDLFVDIASEDTTKLKVVLDANVFFDLHDESDAESRESRYLLGPWLHDSVMFLLTEEIFHEINRNEDKIKREGHRKHVHKHERVTPTTAHVEAAQQKIRQFFPATLTPSDQSDLNHIANTIAADVEVFVTRDERLLDLHSKFFDLFGVSIIRPAELINRLDLVRRQSEYQPIRLAGSDFKLRLVKVDDETALIERFQLSNHGESVASFLKLLRQCLCSPTMTECWLAENNSGPLALFAYDRSGNGDLKIPLLRVARGGLAATVARHVVARAIQIAAREQRPVAFVSDVHVATEIASALLESRFVKNECGWWKINACRSGSSEQLITDISSIGKIHRGANTLAENLIGALREHQITKNSVAASEIERVLWPGKILDSDVPSFIVPIQPLWAQNLFDENLSNQELFPARAELVLKRELVYYRANQQCGLAAPGRILWYISSDQQWQDTMCIRACSRLDEIVVGTAKELFSRFRRLGIYEWRNLMELTDNDPEKKVMALRFSETELLPSTVSREAFRKEGVTANLQSPLRVDKDLFAKIYSLGHK